MKTNLKLASSLGVFVLLLHAPVTRGQETHCHRPKNSAMSNTDKGVLGGAGIGAATGAIIGAAVKNPVAGEAIGAGQGALSGGLIGNDMDRRKAIHSRRVLGLTDVVQMAQQGVPEGQIIAAIQQSKSTFNLSPDDLIYLRQQAVSDRIVRAMLATVGKGSALDRELPGDLVGELLAILNETQSVDTLCVTVESLVGMKADAKRILPALIRNAERLKLLEGVANDGERSERQKAVLEAIDFFTKRANVVVVKKAKRWCNTHYPCPQQTCAPCCPPCATTGSTAAAPPPPVAVAPEQRRGEDLTTRRGQQR